MSYSGAGVLPYAFFNNTIYFLVAREHKEQGWTGSNTFSDFGGSVESKHKSTQVLSEYGANPDEYATITAAVEFWEETMGLFLTSKEVFNMFKSQKGLAVPNGPYLEHLLRVEYNPFWVEIFKNAYNYVLSCAVPHKSKIGMMHIPSCPEGFTEKTEIKWISYADLQNAVNTNNTEFRPEFRNTLKKLFQQTEFQKLLSEASIFKDPQKTGFVAPIISEPIIAKVEYKWPSFYPDPSQLNAVGLINSITDHYQYLLFNTKIPTKITEFAQMFQYIDTINQTHYEVKHYIYLKAIPSSQPNDLAILPLIHWNNNYCPLTDTNLQTKKLGSGSYGTTYLMTGPTTKCCAKPLQIVTKSIEQPIDSAQLANLVLDGPCKKVLPAKGKVTDIFATECVSLAMVNCLVKHSVCYNFPYFYGAALCNQNNITYMYMQYIEDSFNKQSVNDIERDSIILQGLMGIYAMYKLKLVHGDINALNLAYNLLPSTVTKRPVYQVGSSYFIGPMTNKILYFIDFGMGFIKDKLEPAPRIEKDKQRVNNNVNWSLDIKPNTNFKMPAFNAYKGYYVANKGSQDAAYLRRHLLDLYLLFDTFNTSFGVTKLAGINTIRDAFLPYFYNPAYFAKNLNLIKGATSADTAINNIWEDLLIGLIGNSTIRLIDETELQKLNPSDLMFLGNLNYVLG